jgi:hypothetical protein
VGKATGIFRAKQNYHAHSTSCHHVQSLVTQGTLLETPQTMTPITSQLSKQSISLFNVNVD